MENWLSYIMKEADCTKKTVIICIYYDYYEEEALIQLMIIISNKKVFPVKYAFKICIKKLC